MQSVSVVRHWQHVYAGAGIIEIIDGMHASTAHTM